MKEIEISCQEFDSNEIYLVLLHIFALCCLDIDLCQRGNERNGIECVSDPDHCEGKKILDGAKGCIPITGNALVKPLPAAATSSGAFLP